MYNQYSLAKVSPLGNIRRAWLSSKKMSPLGNIQPVSNLSFPSNIAPLKRPHPGSSIGFPHPSQKLRTPRYPSSPFSRPKMKSPHPPLQLASSHHPQKMSPSSYIDPMKTAHPRYPTVILQKNSAPPPYPSRSLSQTRTLCYSWAGWALSRPADVDSQHYEGSIRSF
jgi:hypothetical protein